MTTIEKEWAERVRAAAAARTPLCLRAGGSKDFYGGPLAGEPFELRGNHGVVAYEPTELVVTVRAGTPLAELEAVLAATDIDESRVIAEAAIYADHVAVDEETVRLRSHIAQLRQMLESGSPVGRKADFLIQEFNREANTIGSKCQNADIAKVVVDLKSEIEKIREQIQNIE